MPSPATVHAAIPTAMATPLSSIVLSPPMPTKMITRPILISRLPSHREFIFAWNQEPAVQDSVVPVTATPASTGLRCRRIVIASVTNASAPKKQNVSRPRLSIVAGSPYLADSVPAGSKRRSTGRPSASPATVSEQPMMTLGTLSEPAPPSETCPVADPTASVSPPSTRPAQTATPTPSISRCGWPSPAAPVCGEAAPALEWRPARSAR